MVKTRLYVPHIVIQLLLGTLVPIFMLGLVQLVRMKAKTRRVIYVTACTLTMIGIFAMRWNVVIGGQLFSKSFLGYRTYKLEFAHREGLLPAVILMVLPLVILAVLIRIFPPWEERSQEA